MNVCATRRSHPVQYHRSPIFNFHHADEVSKLAGLKMCLTCIQAVAILSFSCSADHPDMDFTQFLQVNTRIEPEINPQLVPSASFPANFIDYFITCFYTGRATDSVIE